MRSFVQLVLGIIIGGVLVLGFSSLVGGGRRAPAPVPEIGGQPVPEQLIEIDFDQRYDVHTSVYGVEPMTLLNCKIRGFTGSNTRPTSSGVFSGSGAPSRYHFDHWLVLEQPDARLVYLPSDSVKYIEQTTARKP